MKINGIIIFIVGYVIKGGVIVGFKILEYMVDIVLYFEGDLYYMYCILWVVKNWFGLMNELGIFEMWMGGLYEVVNLLEIFLEECLKDVMGFVIVVLMEGIWLILVEV